MVGPQTIWVNDYNITLYKGLEGVKISSVHYIGGFLFKRILGGKERGPKGKGWRPEWPRAGGVLGEGQPVPSPLARGLRELCKLPSGVRGGVPAAKGFSRILNTQDDLLGQQDYGPVTKSGDFTFCVS